MPTIQTLTAAALLAISANASAQSFPCEFVGKIAENLMKQHQEGVSLSIVMRTLDGIANAGDRAENKALAIAAYDTPRFSTPEMQRRAINRFRDEALVKCHKAR